MNMLKNIEELASNEVFKKIQEIANKYGYVFSIAVNIVNGDSIDPYADVYRMDAEGREYRPEVGFRRKNFWSNEHEWKIYSTNNTSDEYAKGLRDAENFVKEISKIDVKDWPGLDSNMRMYSTFTPGHPEGAFHTV